MKCITEVKQVKQCGDINVWVIVASVGNVGMLGKVRGDICRQCWKADWRSEEGVNAG